MTTYAAVSKFGGRVVFRPGEWERGDLIGAAAMRLHCLWSDILAVDEVQKTPENMQGIVAKIRELAKTARIVTAETPREFAVGVADQYLYEISRMSEMLEVAAGWRRDGIVGQSDDDKGVIERSRDAASALAKQAQGNAMPAFDDLDDDLIDRACDAGGLYRMDLMRAYDVLKEGV